MSSSSVLRALRRCALVASLVAFVAASSACGSRSRLYPGEPCLQQGDERACLGVCGEGIETCEGGIWSKCEVPPATRACEDACGVGLQTCTDERWGRCEVTPYSVSCEGTCGVGERECRDGEWAECLVPETERACASVCGEGTEICRDGEWGRCDAPLPLPITLEATIRDFSISHPDFELDVVRTSRGGEQGIVATRLGSDGKPVYVGGQGIMTTGEANFDQWFRDVPGVNQTKVIELPLSRSTDDPRLYRYEGRNFFPIDGELFGNEGNFHNFHFTLEVAASFSYIGGETFRFEGDDDVWVFVNGHLVIDLGGLHESLSASVSLDEVAQSIGIEPGGEYSLHIFFAERHTVSSNFIIDTSIAAAAKCE